MGTLNLAINIASEAFKNKNDKGGQPYILHCIEVMNKVKHLGHLAMICAILHDVVEDCEKEGYDFQYLDKSGFSSDVIRILKLLTHDKNNVDYMDYIKNLSTDITARKIKMADLEHNTQVTRLKGLRKKDFDRLEKYLRAYEYLRD